MQITDTTENILYYGDNLNILSQHISSESIDLIYLDPPFNSNRDYNVFKDEAGIESKEQITAFEDTWHWNHVTEQTYHDLQTQAPDNISQMITALRGFIGTNQMMAYLVMMTARLIELHRVLKPTGSLYLHCDPTASHYLKIILDTIFGAKNFRDEISWRRSGRRSSIYKIYRHAHDIIFFYTKTDDYIFNLLYEEKDETLLKKYTQEDARGKFRLVPLMASGRVSDGETGKIWRGYDPNTRGKGGMHWLTTHAKLEEYVRQGLVAFPKKEGGVPQLKYYLDQNKGVPLSDFWDDIDIINSMGNEALGYPTQKPLALLERIIQASSNPGDIILDPFCGCGTAVEAAQKLGRRWIGIDIAHLAVTLQICRLESLSPGIRFQMINYPNRISEAKALAQQNRSHFRYWALGLIRAWPYESPQSKADKKRFVYGIDGTKPLFHDHKQVLVQVKCDPVQSDHIRTLVDIVQREQAAMGVLLTLELPSHTLLNEAANAGLYRAEQSGQEYPKIQIITIQDALDGKSIDMPQDLNDFQDVG